MIFKATCRKGSVIQLFYISRPEHDVKRLIKFALSGAYSEGSGGIE